MSAVRENISPSIPDWSRETRRGWWDPSRQLLHSIRRYQRWKGRMGPLGFFMSRYHLLRHRFWSVVTGADIPLNCQIDGGLLLIHPNGIVIHPTAKLGPNCFVLHQVTIVGGVRVGGRVDFGAGAKIIRPVQIGDNAQIGANSVVLHDVPPDAIVVGIPARVVPPKKSSSEPAS